MKRPHHIELPSYDTLLNQFLYNPLTGQLFRKSTQRLLGTKGYRGGLVTYIGGNKHKVERIAYKMMTKTDAPTHVRHLNGNQSDNRWANLTLQWAKTTPNDLQPVAQSHSKRGCWLPARFFGRLPPSQRWRTRPWERFSTR